MSSRRGVVLVFSLIFLALIFSVGSLLLAGLMVGGSASMPKPVPSESSLYLKIEAPWSEVEPLNLFGDLFEGPTSLRQTLNIIRQAKTDNRIKSLVILPSVTGALWAQLQEVRDALVDFRTSGKPITAYLEFGGSQEYYMASAANRIVMTPAGSLDMSGLATYEVFFRGALDKLGVLPDLLHIGDYKTYSNTFTEKGFTPAHREMSQSLNRDWYDELVRAIAQGRKKSEADVRAAIDGGPYMAADAKAAGLVDDLEYDDQLDANQPVKGARRYDADAYAKNIVESSGFTSGPRIAVLYAVGTIASGKSSLDSPGGLVIGSDTFIQWVRKARVDPDIRAIVVRIDSPGGSAIASDVMWRELMLAREVKPVIVSMGDVAASGGYYIAVPANVIVAEPGTITGSIGVVTGKFVVKDLLNNLGVATDSVSDGRMAEIESPFKPFSKDERTRIEDQLRTTYAMFLSRVAEGRHSTPEKIDAIARGRVWTGRQAKANGLVDELGGLDTAIAIAKKRARIDPSSPVDLVVYPAKRTFFDLLSNHLDSSMESVLASVSTKRADLRLLDVATATLRLFRRGEPLTLMPNLFWN